MLKKTVTYEDFDGATQSEDIYFNLSKSELMEMEVSYPGGLEQHMKKVMASNNNPELFRVFKDIILASYGVKSDDGKRFMKSPELVEEFTQTAAFDSFFMELVTDEGVAAEFVKSVIPGDMRQQVEQEEMKQKTAEIMVPPTPPVPPTQ